MGELYQMKTSTFYRSSGPGVSVMSRVLGKSDKYIILDEQWVDWIFSLNDYNPQACANIVSPGYGPSQGYNQKGLLKYLSLAELGRNVIWIDHVVTYKKLQYGVVYGIPMGTVPPKDYYNPFDFSYLIHKLYGVNRKGQTFDLSVPTYCPILGGPWYIPMTELVKIVYPKAVIALYNLNIRRGPTVQDDDNIIGSVPYGTQVYISRLFIGSGGIWGYIEGKGWIALRYNDTNNTNWRV